MGISSSVYAAVAVAITALVAGCGNGSSGGSGDGADAGPDPLGRSVGAACAEPSTLVCGLDEQRAPTGDVLACEKGVLVKSFSCPGGACGTLAGHAGVRCGASTFVAVGGACEEEGSAACVPDRTAVAVCRSKTWTEGHHCGSPLCDFLAGEGGVTRAQCGPEDLYSLGDHCTFPFGHGVCAADHAAVLNCRDDGTTQVLYACTAAQTCKQVELDGAPAIECYPPAPMP